MVVLVLCGVAGWWGLAAASVFPARVIIFLRYKGSHILSNLYECRTDPLVCVDAMTVKMMPFEHWTLYANVFNLHILSLKIVWSRMAGWLLGHLVPFNMPQGIRDSTVGRILERKNFWVRCHCVLNSIVLRKGHHLLITVCKSKTRHGVLELPMSGSWS